MTNIDGSVQEMKISTFCAFKKMAKENVDTTQCITKTSFGGPHTSITLQAISVIFLPMTELSKYYNL